MSAPGVLWVLAAAGAAAFLFGVFQPDPKATWGIYLVNMIFWSCNCCMIFTAR